MSDLLIAQARAFGTNHVDVYVHLSHPDVRDCSLPTDLPSALYMLCDGRFGAEGFETAGPLLEVVGEDQYDVAWLARRASNFVTSVAVVATDPGRPAPHEHIEGGLDPTMPHGTLRVAVSHPAWLLHLGYEDFTWHSAGLNVCADVALPVVTANTQREEERWIDVPDAGISLETLCELLQAESPDDPEWGSLSFAIDAKARLTVAGHLFEQVLSPVAASIVARVPAARTTVFVKSWASAHRTRIAAGTVAHPLDGFELDVLVDRKISDTEFAEVLLARIEDGGV